ncbi:MAG: RNA 2',3'-cyclic phosphodiesterase [Gaiellaceae bacterium]
MSHAASVAGRDRLRLFCALRLPDDVLDAIERWGRDALAERVVRRENLHITLAFLGPRPAGELAAVVEATGDAARAARPITLVPVRYRETRSVGMLVLSDEHGAAGAFAADLFARLAALGVYEPEARRWLPHVTVVRFRRRPRLDPPLPPIGRFSPSDAAVYHSVLRSTGAQYEVVESFALGG